MRVRLILEKKRKRVWAAELKGPVTTLGRAVGCTIRIPSSQVSRLHCRLRVEDGYVTVEDLESVNGTFINGKRVRSIEVVHPGDRLNLGSLSFVVEYAAPAQRGIDAVVTEDYPVLEPVLDEADEVEVLDELPAASALPVAEPIEEVIGVEEEDLIVLEEDNQARQNESVELGDFIFDMDEEDDESHRR